MSGDERDAGRCCICSATATRMVTTRGLSATRQTLYCDGHAAELIARSIRPTTAPAPREEPWEWHPDGPEAHAMLERVQDEEGGR